MRWGRTRNVIAGGIFFHAVIQGRDITVQLPPEVTPALSGLPRRTPTFTGRHGELNELLGLLDPRRPQAGLAQVAVVAGLAGVGKTELALQVAHASRERGWFPGGALFVDLYGYDPQRRLDPGRALDGLLRALGLPAEHIPPDAQDRARLYSSVLTAFAEQGRAILVVVDNTSSAEQATPLLPTGTAARAVVTSRHTLGDLGARLIDLDVLGAEEAIDLLEKQLQLTRGGSDTRVRENLADARAIVGLCGRLPLAVEIIAALLASNPTRSLRTMAADLADRRTRLDEIRYGDKAVRAAFDLSYRDLDDDQARLFRLLTLNPGPEISTEAAAIVAGQEQRPVRWMLEALARAHLIEHGSTEGRWRMHDMVRIYAEEQGWADGEIDHRGTALDRLLDHYLAAAADADPHIRPLPGNPVSGRFPGREEALAWLEEERENLVGAVGIATADHPGTAILLAAALAEFLDWVRRFDDGITIARIAAATAASLDDKHGEAEALIKLGVAMWKTRSFEDAIKTYQRALAICREIDDKHDEGRALTNLGIVLWEQRRFAEAIEAHQQAVTALRGTGDLVREARALSNLGIALADVYRLEEAIHAYQQALALFREIGDRHGEGGTLHNLAIVLRNADRHEEAIDVCQQALGAMHQTGDPHGEAMALDNLGLALRESGRSEEAIKTHQQALALLQKTADRRGEAGALNNLGLALQEIGRFEEAMDDHQQALTIYRQLGDRPREGTALNNLGLALQAMGRFEEAIEAHQQDIAICQEIGDEHCITRALANLEAANTGRQPTTVRRHNRGFFRRRYRS
jgi:tetratricopeptide (TPR) repeat protein